MGESLDTLDKVLDGNAIVLSRVVDLCSEIMSRHIPKSLEGEDRVAGDNPGFYTLVSEVFKIVKSEAAPALRDVDRLILEYQDEREQARRKALEERGVQTAGKV